MKKKCLLFLNLLAILFLSCTKNQQGKNSNNIKNFSSFSLNSDSISYIRVENEFIKHQINDSARIKTVLLTLAQSKIVYIKFGSENTFSICNNNGHVKLEGYYRDNFFKVNGVVYKSEKKIFDF